MQVAKFSRLTYLTLASITLLGNHSLAASFSDSTASPLANTTSKIAQPFLLQSGSVTPAGGGTTQGFEINNVICPSNTIPYIVMSPANVQNQTGEVLQGFTGCAYSVQPVNSTDYWVTYKIGKRSATAGVLHVCNNSSSNLYGSSSDRYFDGEYSMRLIGSQCDDSAYLAIGTNTSTKRNSNGLTALNTSNDSSVTNLNWSLYCFPTNAKNPMDNGDVQYLNGIYTFKNCKDVTP